jgi:UDP-N-acetylglucosamine 2-epimerase (non-hydrolysing)
MAIKLLCVVGARPNFMKMAPLVRALDADPSFESVLVHTGQHYDENLSGQVLRDLGISAPRHSLNVGSGTHGQQTAEIMRRFEPVLVEEKADGLVVVGDVNSTLACALVAAKLHTPVVHVEAGLRSFDRAMPEEINRVVTDAVADLMLVTEESGVENLRREGVPEARIRFVGNLMIDSLYYHLEKARSSDVAARLGVTEPFGLVTLHRPSNVDDPRQLGEILRALGEISTSLPLVFPMHPRTRSKLDPAALDASRITITDPLGYIDFVGMMSRASVVLTDSGGIQEETTALGIPCLTLRENTERPVTISQGTNRLAGTAAESILAAWRDHVASPKSGRVPRLWDGKAGERCRGELKKFFESRLAAS